MIGYRIWCDSDVTCDMAVLDNIVTKASVCSREDGSTLGLGAGCVKVR